MFQFLSGKEHALLLSAYYATEERRIQFRLRAIAANPQHSLREHTKRDVLVYVCVLR